MTAQATSNASADLALAVYLEPYADRRSVLLLGQAEAPAAAHLERFAGRLDIIDPSSREVGRGEVPELPFDDETFDLVVVSELSALPDPRPDAIRELRRVLSRDGVLAIVSPVGARKRRNEGGTQEALERLMAAEFRHVRVLGQAPMFGYTVSDTEARNAELSIDSSLTRERPERTERVIGIGTDEPLKLEPRLWVQVVASDVQTAGGTTEVDPRFADSLRKAEDEARRALTRESELVRELERERKAREAAESSKERARAMERKLLAIEADYDDAVSRVRYFESLLLEREAADQADHERRSDLEHQLSAARREREQAGSRVAEAEADRDRARAAADAAAQETSASEQRLAELANELTDAKREAKRHEQIARDLLEELRGLEQRALVTVEHDARVSELEAERERAMQRALEAEVARESAQMRVDELRAQLDQPRVRKEPEVDVGELKGRITRLEGALEESRAALADAQRDASRAQEQLADRERELAAARSQAPAHAEAPSESGQELRELYELRADDRDTIDRLRGERTGLALRVAEAERALLALRKLGEDEERALDTKAALADARAQAAIEALGDAEASLKALRAQVEQSSAQPADPARIEELETHLSRAERRVDALERELEEADRFAEDHAEDAERVEALESELDRAREKLDALDDEARALQDELVATRDKQRDHERALVEAQAAIATQRTESARTEAEHAARAEQLLRRESELRAERDDAHAALAEARAILSHLAVRVGADRHDLPAIMQALEQQTGAASSLDALRKALGEAQSARSDAEYQLARVQRQIEERDQRIRELESAPSAAQEQPRFDPPEV